ncbi:hypothetical protein KF840_10210 [bacterium]|nr:hypothetical protein [bacterium]
MKRLAGVVGTVAAVLFCSAAARAAIISCGSVTAVRGSSAPVTISLQLEGDEVVAGTQNDLQFDSDAFDIAPRDCVINPAIGPDTEADKTLSTSLPPGEIPSVRNLVVALDNTNAIPSGALYTCSFHVRGSAELGEHVLTNVNVRASNPQGMVVPTTAGDCTITVQDVSPTPTPRCTNDDDCPSGEVCVNNTCVTATPTRTPIGYCTGDRDCPNGQVCVNNMCVTPTPTRTPIGYCTGDQDCPNGQVCVNNMCVAVTPTATRKSGGGGGCSCEIDPGARGRSGDVLAVLLPALILALRWRRRRA